MVSWRMEGELSLQTAARVYPSRMGSIHGHEVIAMIAGAGHPLSREEIVAAAGRNFGADARYHTCSAEGLSADSLVDFLKERGKLTGGDDELSLDTGEVCQH